MSALAAAFIAFVAAGVYDVSAQRPHTSFVYQVIKQTRDRAVDRRSRDVEVPKLGDRQQIEIGMGLFEQHCVRCHGAPGVAPEAFALGLQPLATPLVQSARELPPRSLYWIVRNGLKMTAMPAFEFRMDEAQLWSVVAALLQLPLLSPADYRALAKVQAATPFDPVLYEPDRNRGRQAIAQYGCVSCHKIPGLEGPEARVGPTLHGIGARRMIGGVLPNSPENLARWIVSPQSVTPLTAMPDLGVSERDARDMAAWLSALK